MTSTSIPKRIHWSKLYQYLDKQEKENPYPCDKKVYENQCAVRMGRALAANDIYMVPFKGARCGLPNHEPTGDDPAGHILRARELANYLRSQTGKLGNVKIYKKATPKDFEDKRGIMFIQKPTEARGLDHIDLWDGRGLKQKTANISWISACDQVWFWDLWPSIVKPQGGDVAVYSDVKTSMFNNEPDLVSPPLALIKTNRPVSVAGKTKTGEFLRVNMAKFDDPTNAKTEEFGWIKSGFIELPEPPAATTTGVVTARSLQIRKDHSTGSATVAGSGFRKGQEVTILEIWSDGKDTWAKLAPDQWAAIESNGETLIEGVF
jgi:hypothetical protein